MIPGMGNKKTEKNPNSCHYATSYNTKLYDTKAKLQ